MIYSIKWDWAEVCWREISYAFVGRVVGALLAATLIALIADSKIISLCVGAAVLIG